MKQIFKTSAMMMAMAAMTIGTSSCSKDENNNGTQEDAASLAVVEQFVDHTVNPTYTTLAAKAEQLANQLAALKSNPTQSALNDACETFLAAREAWEKSEAFLYGAAGDFGIDPHIDSWPLDEDAFNTLMGSSDMIAALE